MARRRVIDGKMVVSILSGELVDGGPESYTRARFEFLHNCPENISDEMLKGTCL